MSITYESNNTKHNHVQANNIDFSINQHETQTMDSYEANDC